MPLPNSLAHIARATLALSLLLSTAAAHAQWQYRDAQGRMVFSDQPPPPGTKDSDIIKGPGFTTNKPQAPRADMPRPDMSGPRNSTPSANAAAASPAPAAAAASAQRGSTSRGVVYTDGTSATPPAPDAKAAAAKDGKAAAPTAAKDAKPAEKPLTPEEAFQKRQKEAREAEEKAAKTKADADRKAQACNQNREALRNLESGQRVATTDAKGERVFLDDAQRAARAAQLRDAVAKTCN
jgi:hypothetical protein